MALDRLVSLVLRAAELVFAAIVAGVTGEYLHKSNASSWALGRFIYTEVVAGISIFLALIWLFPFSSTFVHWPVDIFISILWWVVFGLLANVSVLDLLQLLCRKGLADPDSYWEIPAVLGSTGTTFPPGEINVANLKPTLLLPFCPLFSGSYLHLLASFGCASKSAVREPRWFITAAVGTAEATFKGSTIPIVARVLILDAAEPANKARQNWSTRCQSKQLLCGLIF